MRIAMPRTRERRRSSSNKSSGGRMVQSLTSNSSVDAETRDAVRAEHKRSQIAGYVEALLGNRDQLAGHRTLLGCRDAFKALVVREGLEVGRHADRLPTSKQPVPTIVEPNDLFDALDAHVEKAVALGEGLGVIPATCGERSAVLPQNGRHFRVGDSGRSAVAINNSAVEP